MNLHFPLPKIRTIDDELTLSLAKNSHFSFLPSHFPSLPSRRGHHWGAEIRNEFTLSIAKFFRPLFPPLSNGTSRATSDRKPKTNDQLLPSPILFFPSKKWIKLIERFSKPNIRFGPVRTGSKIVSKFRLTHNRKLRSANRNTIYHTIACPALLLWCLAVENRVPCVPKKCSLSNVQVRGTPSAKSSITGDPMANTSCPFIHWWWPCTCRKLISCCCEKVHRQASWMEATIWPCSTSDKSSEVWGMVWTWRGYERKTVEYLTKERPDISRQVLRSAWGQTESKIRFGSGPGWPKVSDGSAAFFDSIFDLEPGHRPKPSNRTEIRFVKPL